MTLTTPVAAALLLVGLVAVVHPARLSAASVLDGTWAVAQATLNGEPRIERKVLNSTWTFRGDELVMQQAGGVRSRWALTFDPAAEPPAFRATPLDAPGERPVWMILSRRDDELRLAFYDGLDRRPEDFGPRRKLVVLTLVPAVASTVADPCKILKAAGADRLLGGPTRGGDLESHREGRLVGTFERQRPRDPVEPERAMAGAGRPPPVPDLADARVADARTLGRSIQTDRRLNGSRPTSWF